MRDGAKLLDALGQQRQGRLTALVGGEAHEAIAAPRQHRAEDIERALFAPIDDQMLARARHPRAPVVLRARPACLDVRHGTTEGPRRALVARGAGLGQQPLGGDAAARLFDLLPDEVIDAVCIESAPWGRPRLPDRPCSPALHHPFHGLVIDAAELGSSSIAAELQVGVDNVHALPLRLQWAPPAVAGVGFVTSTIAIPGSPMRITSDQGVETFEWP
jgi:hypothetical protein